MKFYLFIYFILFNFWVYTQTYNTDAKTIATVTAAGVAADGRIGMRVRMISTTGNIAKNYQQYYERLYTTGAIKNNLKRGIKRNDNKLKMVAKYTVLIALTTFLATYAPSGNDPGVFRFLSQEKLAHMLNVLMPQLLARAVFLKSYSNSNLTTLDLSYLISGQHDILRSSSSFNLKLDKVLYLIIILAIIKIIIGTQTPAPVKAIKDMSNIMDDAGIRTEGKMEKEDFEYSPNNPNNQ